MSVATLAYIQAKKPWHFVGGRAGVCWCLVVSNGSVAEQIWLKDGHGAWVNGPGQERQAKAIARDIVKQWKGAPERITWKTEGRVFRVRW